MSTIEDLASKIRDLKPRIKERYRATGIELLGSNIRGDQREDSDIDFLVEFEEGADLFDLIGLTTFLEEELKRNIDVVPKQALREELRESILREAVPI